MRRPPETDGSSSCCSPPPVRSNRADRADDRRPNGVARRDGDLEHDRQRRQDKTDTAGVLAQLSRLQRGTRVLSAAARRSLPGGGVSAAPCLECAVFRQLGQSGREPGAVTRAEATAESVAGLARQAWQCGHLVRRGGPRVAGGRQPVGDQPIRAIVRSCDGARGFAHETGGEAFVNPSDLESVVDRIWRDASHFYVLGCAPPSAKKGRRNIRVHVTRQDLDVHARETRSDQRLGFHAKYTGTPSNTIASPGHVVAGR